MELPPDTLLKSFKTRTYNSKNHQQIEPEWRSLLLRKWTDGERRRVKHVTQTLINQVQEISVRKSQILENKHRPYIFSGEDGKKK